MFFQFQTYVPPPQVQICRYDENPQGKCDPMVVPAIGKFIPARNGSGICTNESTCNLSWDDHYEYSCVDKRRVLVTTENGLHLCILFPDPVK